jgi:hypothetical protein
MYGMTSGLQQVAKGRTESGMTAVADMQRPGWVGGDELQQDTRFFFVGLATVIAALGEYRLDFGMKSDSTHMKIYKARARNVDFIDLVAVANPLDEHCGKLSGVFAGRLGQPHGNVARKVTMRRISCPLDGALNREFAGCLRKLRHVCEGVLYELRDYGLHFSGLAEFASRNSTGNFALVA